MLRVWRNSGVIHLITCLLLAISAGMPASLMAQATAASSPCQGSTVDNQGAKIAKESREFLARLQAAVRANDREQIAGMVNYPLLVFSYGKKTHIRQKSSFLDNYDEIFTPPVRNAILNQTPQCLFGNANGEMVGRGELWFSEQSTGEMKIITVNESAASM